IDIAERRGELILVDDQEQYSSPSRPPGAFTEHFFHGHTIDLGSSFSISSDMQSGKDKFVSFKVACHTRDENGKRKLSGVEHYTGDLALVISNKNGLPPGGILPAFLSQETKRIILNARQSDEFTIPPVQYVFPELTRAGSLSAMWNALLSDGRETDVVEVMQILAPEVKAIHFLSKMNRYLNLASDSVIVVFDSGERVPLGTLGDGMRYLLGLAISLVYADGGVILIDEIDTGLHYSVMGDLWKLVVETAKQRNIQVFATTHSQDCVRGLAWLCDNYPDLKQEVSLQKIDPDIKKAVDVDGDGIVLAVDQRIEVR
ncbi:MAG: ATP-binding protein, partial [Planctomycetota bacterium]|nr:ATP-binding protein [Planctomycetota bacterium]